MTIRWSVALVAAGAVAALAGLAAAQAVSAADTSIGGVVRSAAGPEAGVWVIAETDDLETGFRKIVVTGDDGRFLIPELATATYDVWVRGYGLADSERRAARPGDTLELTVAAAADAAGGGGGLPGQLLVLADRGTRRRRTFPARATTASTRRCGPRSTSSTA